MSSTSAGAAAARRSPRARRPGRAPRAAPRRTAAPAGRPRAAGRPPCAPQSTISARDLAAGLLGRGDVPARLPSAARAARRRAAESPGDHHERRRRRPARGRLGIARGGASPRRTSYQPRPVLRPWRPAATIRALQRRRAATAARRSDCAKNDSAISKPTSIADEVLQLERPHPEAAAAGGRSGRPARRRRAPPARSASPRGRTAGCSG